MYEPGSVFLRVIKSAAGSATAADAYGERTAVSAGAAIANLRRLLDDGFHRRSDEVSELNFRDGPQPDHRRTNRRRDDVALGERRVQHALFAKFFVKSSGSFENAAGESDILAHHEDAVVALHLLRHRLSDGVNHRYRAWHSLVPFYSCAQMCSASSDGSAYGLCSAKSTASLISCVISCATFVLDSSLRSFLSRRVFSKST